MLNEESQFDIKNINTRYELTHTMNLHTKNRIAMVVVIVAIGTSILASSVVPVLAQSCVSCIIHPSEAVKFTCEGTGPGGTLDVKMKVGETLEVKCLPRSK